jgi:asparagine synthase (glutamine-hydrolysing)
LINLKWGFSISFGDCLRNPLQDWAEDLLLSPALADTGLVAAAPARKLVDAHCAGAVNRPHEIWTVLMLQAWHRHRFGQTAAQT